VKLSARNRLFLTVGGLALALIALSLFVIVPQLTKLATLDDEIAQAQSEVEMQRTLLEQRQTMKDEAAATSAELIKLGTVMPNSPELPDLIIDLQDTAYASGVKLFAVVPQAPVLNEDSTYTIIALDLVVNGTWADTVDFLQRLQRLPRGIREVQFTATTAPVDETGSMPLYSQQTNVRIEAYSIAPSRESNVASATAGD